MEKDSLTSSFLALREKLHASAMRFLKDDEDAKDAMQDTFLRLWQKGSTHSEPEARNKLFTVLRNICIDRLRKPVQERISEADTERVHVPPDQCEDMERLETMLTAGLSHSQRLIYSLLTHEGLDYEDIADRLRMSPQAVRMAVSRTRKKISENYKKLNS